MTWKSETFSRAVRGFGPVTVSGYTHKGLGLFMAIRASPKGRRPPTWHLIHLNSGHSVASIKGFVAEAFPVAYEIAECADWDFSSLDGWRNQQPDLPGLVNAIIKRHAKRAEIKAGGGSDAEVAAQILMARA